MCQNNNRIGDEQREDLINEFLRINIYPELERIGFVSDINIAPRGSKSQIEGTDVFWTYKGKRTRVDAKTRWGMTNHVCSNLNLEIATNNQRGTQILGWYIDPSVKTQWYLFIHITKANGGVGGKEDITGDNIEEVRFQLINKKEMDNMFAEHGLTPLILDKLARKAESCYRQTGRRQYRPSEFNSFPVKSFIDKEGKKHSCRCCYISASFSKGMPENPINLVIHEDMLMSLPSSVEMIWRKDQGLIIKEKSA